MIRRLGLLSIISTFGLLIILSPFANVIRATDFTSTSFKVKDPVIEGLGGFSTSQSFQLLGTIPFIEPLKSISSSFISLPGFLNFPASTTASSTTSSTTTSGSGGGGGGDATIPKPIKEKPPEKVLTVLDCNSDGRINLIDLSCLLYYADKTGPIIEPHDYNKDKKIDLIDISILLYYWYDPA